MDPPEMDTEHTPSRSQNSVPLRASSHPAAVAQSEPDQGIRIHGSRRGPVRLRTRRGISFEARLRLLALLIAVPGLLVTGGLLFAQHASGSVWATLLGLILFATLILYSLLLEHVVRPLQTLTNVVGALREDDYAFRARGSSTGDALGELAIEINALADMLQAQRAGALEASALLGRVVASIDAPVLAFDPGDVLRLLNPGAERVFSLSAEQSIGKPAAQLGLTTLLAQPDEGIVELDDEGRGTRWVVHRSTFRQRGVPHALLLLTDVSAALREEERQAWRRLIRVLGHEINNSLAPIKSIAGSLRTQLLAETATDEDLERGLHIVESRAESLHRFVQAYRQLAQLPPPKLQNVRLAPLVERTLALEQRLRAEIKGGPDVTLTIDPDQVEQMLINLVRNAVEAALSARTGKPRVEVGWQLEAGNVVIAIDDNGPGIANDSNLFVPFYTTKSGGSGVGLALARQIVEAHAGSVRLMNRRTGGVRAIVTLPVARTAATVDAQELPAKV
jgi:two-component system, NtrC family, nitrogen regulation sensor histidine kinase NtrY